MKEKSLDTVPITDQLILYVGWGVPGGACVQAVLPGSEAGSVPRVIQLSTLAYHVQLSKHRMFSSRP
jgi:hypothetical protein